jgi:hypothetical protein
LETAAQLFDSTQEQLREARIQHLSEDSDALQDALSEALDEETQWDFYHGSLSIEDAIEMLQDHLEPTEVEVAETLFQEAIAARPGTDNALSKEVFHQKVVSALVRLAAGKSPVAIPEAAALIARFSDKTEVVCRYLEAMMNSRGADVVSQIENILNSDTYTTAWQKAWLIRTLGPGMQFAAEATVIRLSTWARSSEVHWIVRVEALKALAWCDKLDQALVTTAWKLAPPAYKPDILAAVARVTSADWARRFVSVANLDPVDKVVVSHVVASQVSPAD